VHAGHPGIAREPAGNPEQQKILDDLKNRRDLRH
jgi:hypothetical protein